MAQVKQLDPRLRRLVRSAPDAARLRRDTDAGLLTAAVAREAAAGPSDFLKRVLVQLAGGASPPQSPNWNWRELVPGFYACSLPVTELEELASRPEVLFVEAGRPLRPQLDTSRKETKADTVHAGAPGEPALRGSGVIVGVIDIGLDYTLDDFKKPDGTTRVAFLWDQALTPMAGEQPPAGFPYGVEYTASQINAALNAGDPFSVVRHKPEPGSHGTHVAGIAAGNGRSAGGNFAADKFIGLAPESTIIFVQPAIEPGNATFTDSVRAAEAVAYIFEKAQQMGLPCVVNMSLGQNGGSHDGESLLERAIDRLLETPGRAFVVAAGNEHIWREHASGVLAPGSVRTLQWKVGGGLPLSGGGSTGSGADVTPNEMEIWYSSRDLFEVRVTDPLGNATEVVSPGNTVGPVTLSTGNQIFIDSERFTRLNGDARIYIEVSRGTSSPVQAGVWQVEIRAVESRNGRFDAWIERDARRSANNFADQSFFVGADFDPKSTLGTPATGRRSIAVANYDHVTQAVQPSSGRGPTRDGRSKPEISAPGTDILSSGAMGARPNPVSPLSAIPMRVRMSGTSMASPHVAGVVALLLQERKELTAEQIRKLLIASAAPPPGVPVFDMDWGFGRLDAASAVRMLRQWMN